MSQINLTRSIRTDAVAGSMLPWETPYTTEPIATLERNGANLFHIQMSPAASTRLIGARVARPEAPSIRDIEPHVLLDRPATVIRIPASTGTQITRGVVIEAIQAAEPRVGDALLLVTGWGDRSAAAAIDEAGVRSAPVMTAAAVAALGDVVAELRCPLVLVDLPYLDGIGGPTVQEEWGTLEPWLRPSWPSSAARAYLRHYSPSAVAADWRPLVALLDRTLLVLGIVGGGALQGPRVTVNVAPLQVDDVGEAPCTVVARQGG